MSEENKEGVYVTVLIFPSLELRKSKLSKDRLNSSGFLDSFHALGLLRKLLKSPDA